MKFDDHPSDHNDDEKYMTIDFHDGREEEACWTYLFQFGHYVQYIYDIRVRFVSCFVSFVRFAARWVSKFHLILHNVMHSP